MATEFVRLGWDMKAMQKLIVMSAAYRQSARTPTATELNILVAGLARRQAEFDAAPDKAATLIAYGETDAASTHPPAELAAWTMMANVLMNMDEFVTRE